ncbi:MAG: hypothetical protein ACJ705_06185 [Nitrososphaeraceae archaeon]
MSGIDKFDEHKKEGRELAAKHIRLCSSSIIIVAIRPIYEMV